MAKEFEEITKEEFQAYERVRKSGRYNMYDTRAESLSGLDRKTYFGVLTHYNKLNQKWPDVRGRAL